MIHLLRLTAVAMLLALVIVLAGKPRPPTCVWVPDAVAAERVG